MRLYTLREHIAYYEGEKNTWETHRQEKLAKEYALREHMYSKITH